MSEMVGALLTSCLRLVWTFLHIIDLIPHPMIPIIALCCRRMSTTFIEYIITETGWLRSEKLPFVNGWLKWCSICAVLFKSCATKLGGDLWYGRIFTSTPWMVEQDTVLRRYFFFLHYCAHHGTTSGDYSVTTYTVHHYWTLYSSRRWSLLCMYVLRCMPGWK